MAELGRTQARMGPWGIAPAMGIQVEAIRAGGDV